MNWAGYPSGLVSAPNCAKGIAPESYQTSITSGTRVASPPHVGQANVTESTKGRCGSSPPRSRPASSASDASESTQVTWESGHTHSGSGVPQYLVRDRAQSTLLRSHSPYRPDLTVSGNQFVLSF